MALHGLQIVLLQDSHAYKSQNDQDTHQIYRIFFFLSFLFRDPESRYLASASKVCVSIQLYFHRL